MSSERAGFRPPIRRLIAATAATTLSFAAWAAAPAAPALAASNGPVITQTTGTIVFATVGQGMWGPGAPAALGSGSVNLFPPITWNKGASASNITTINVDSNLDIDSTNAGDTDGDSTSQNDLSCTMWNNDWNGSISEDGEINGQDNDNDISSDGQTCVDSNADIDYINLDTDGDGGSQNDLTATQWGGSISAQTNGDVGLQMALQNISPGSVSVNYPVSVTQTVAAPSAFVKSGDQVTFGSSWHAQSGASLTTTAATGAAGLNASFGFSASASGQICVVSCSSDTVIGVSVPDKTYTLFSPTGTSESASGFGVSGSVMAPSFGVDSSSLSGNTLTASGALPFWDLNVSLDGMVQGLTGLPLSASSSVAGVNFGYDIMSGDANPSYSSAQTLTFSPTVTETLTFGQAVAYTTYDGQGNEIGSGQAASVTFPADGKAVITVPSIASGSLTYSTSYALSGSDFTNNSTVQGSVSSNFSALSLNASFTNAGALSLGPVYQTSNTANYSIPLYGSQSPFGLTASSWSLGGFNTANFIHGQLQVDSIPPTTTATLSGPHGKAGWYLGPVGVSLAATDNPGGSGVAATYYSLDGGAYLPYTAPFTVTGDGQHSVEYYSVDNAGNQETPQSLTIAIDQTSPTTTATVAGTMGSGGWYMAGSPVTLTLSASDNPGGSGVAATYYTVNGGAPVAYQSPVQFPNGTYAVTYYSVDNAGNQEPAHDTTFKVDQTPPVTQASVSGPAGHAGWYLGPVSVALSATDNPGGSGVASTAYRVDGGAPQTYDGAFPISTNGTHSIEYYSTDKAGNLETAKTLTVMIDQTAPTTTESIAGTMGTNGWYKAGSPVVLTLSATDNQGGSGVSQTFYAVGSGPATLYTQPVTFPDGVYSVSYHSTDVAGNMEASQSVAFKVDQTPPVITYAGNAGAYTVDQNVDITCSASDALSGVASTTCANLQVPAYTLSLGSHTLTAVAEDKAGNTATASTTFTVSVTYPSMCALTTQFEGKAGVATSLCAKLDAAAAQVASGQTAAATHILSAYEHELSAQSGKSISAAHVQILDQLVSDLENGQG